MVVLSEAASPKTILVVDDTPNNLQLLAEYLDNANYEISLAINGRKAISIARKVQPDLILLDVMMPDMDGFDVCRHLKNEPLTKDIPIIFMTALTETQDKIKGLKFGAADYITKPFAEEELLTRINIHLSLSHLYKASLKDAQQRKLMLEVSDRIRRSLKLEIIFNTAIVEIAKLFHCDFVGIATLEQQQIKLNSYTSSDEIEIEPNAQIPYEYICPSQAIYNSYIDREPFLIENSPLVTPLPDASLRAIVPLTIRNSKQHTQETYSSCQDRVVRENILYGWLIVDRSQPNSWRKDEIDLLQELSTHLSMGIQQGLLHEKLSELALLDSLTHAYNRRSFDRQLEREWRKLKRIPAPLSLIMCDIDYFKIYNDTYGNQQGDKCLQEVARAIAAALKRPGDVLARYGGEEFAIILPQTSQAGAIKVGENIRQSVKNLKITHQNSLVDSILTLSMGVATTIPNAADDPELLLAAADLALYQAKGLGRDRVSVYPESIAHAKNREELKIRWVRRLRQALEQDLFSLYAQSITPLKDSSLYQRFEVLLRLTDEANRVILPGVFLDIAEHNYLMTDIDIWVINNLLAALEKCDRSSLENCRFSVNLSGLSLNNESFLQFLKRRLVECSLPPKIFCFEITESVAISNLDRVVEFINSLKEIGCSFALDDFGKGLSSLTYLKSLPVDYLKIDGSFIKELNIDPLSEVIVEAINHIAKGIGLKIIAEFVENEDILDKVRTLDVDYAQGFHLGRPIALDNAISDKYDSN
ncbi:MAG: EAL domain-containing protein [Cyanobacteria bacterium P01_G01_bin.19]